MISLSGWIRPAALNGALDDCSLVIPTYRRPDDVVSLLTHLASLRDIPGEVVVVDGSPDDLTDRAVASFAASRPLPYRLQFVRSPAGLTRQRNVGLDASAGEYIYFLDDDCRPYDGYFAALHEVFRADVERRVGAVAGSVMNQMNEPLSLRWRVRFALGLVPRGTPGTYYPTATSVPRSLMKPFTGTRQVDIVPGGAVAYRREVFADQRFSLFFAGYAQGEDLEMSRRIARRWKLLWCGDAHVDHNHAASGRPPSAERGRMEVRNRYFIWKRHTAHPRLVDRFRFWGDIAYVAAYDLVSALAHPTRPVGLAHAYGCVQGVASCLLSPPRYDEPPAAREYVVELREGDARPPGQR